MDESIAAAGSTPTRVRLVDYFVEVSADVVTASTHNGHEHEDFDRHIVQRIPLTDHADFPLPDGVPHFCIPSCLSSTDPSAYERKPTFFSFSLTGGDGSRAYGFALHFYEKLDAHWRPRVFCLISHHPFFSLFKEIVSWVYRRRTHSSEQQVVDLILADAKAQSRWFLSPRGAPDSSSFADACPRPRAIPRAVSEGAGDAFENPQLGERPGRVRSDQVYLVLLQLVMEAECPSPGSVLDLHLDGRSFFKYHVQRGNVAHLDDYCFQVLFQCLSLKNIVYIVNCMLLEQRILIHSNHHGLLTPVCEALCALLFPFVWEHVYVPFLPVKLIEYLQAPVPYLMGLHTSSLATRIGAEIFSSCVVVHLDKDKVVTPISSRADGAPVDFVLARLPAQEIDVLVRAVETIVPQPINSAGHTGTAHVSRASSLSSPLKHVVASLDFSSTLQPSFENEVELTFNDGPLGITFESTHMRLLAVNHFQPGKQPGTSAVVKALPRLQNGLPGPAERSGLIQPGSFLIAINGASTLDLTFDETIDRLRVERRPTRLRFLNAPAPHENACRFAERLQSLSLVSALQIDHTNSLMRWVDTVRSSFAMLFTSIFRDYQRFILIEHTARSPSRSVRRRPQSSPSASRCLSTQAHAALRRRRSSLMAFSVTFDHTSFLEATTVAAASTPAPASASTTTGTSSTLGFLREFTQTQCFSGFINDSVMGRISHTTTFPQVELFHHCVHLFHELEDAGAAKQAIALLFERDLTAIETLVLDLPKLQEPEHDKEASLLPVLNPIVNGSPARSPARSPGEYASPVKRASKTRQLEMMICGSLQEPAIGSDAGSDVPPLSLAALDMELAKEIEELSLSAKAQAPPKSPSSSKPRRLSGSHRSESLSSSGSTTVIDDEPEFDHELEERKSSRGSASKSQRPEDSVPRHGIFRL